MEQFNDVLLEYPMLIDEILGNPLCNYGFTLLSLK